MRVAARTLDKIKHDLKLTGIGFMNRCLLCEVKDGQLTPHALLFF